MNKKLRVSFFSILWRFLLVFLAICVVAYFGLAGVFVSYNVETGVVFNAWQGEQILVASLIVVVSIGLLIASYFSYYYVIEKDHFICVKLGRTFQYDYKNIVFIDVDKSKKQDTITFYMSTAKMQYLIHDKGHVLLETMLKKCPELMSVEEFRTRHPEEKYK